MKPQLRFKEFTDEWQEKKLGDIADVKRGAASQHLKYIKNPNQGIRLLRINDFLNNDAVYVEDNTDMKKYRVKKGDLLIAGTGATAGIIFIVPEKFDGMAFSYNVPRIRVLNANYNYLYLYLKSDLILKQQKGLFVGNAQHFLDTDVMRGFKINLPSIQEQTKIAGFLGVVDEKINHLENKKSQFEKYKKGVMQLIFPPSTGSGQAKIRFKDKNGKNYPEWEEKKLGELNIKVSDGNYGEKYPKSSEMLSNGIPFIRANNIKKSKLIWDDMKFISPELHALLTSGHLKSGDILITTRGDIGSIAMVTKEFEGSNINAQICLLRVEGKISSKFLYQYLGTNAGKTQFRQFQTGSALKQLPKQKLAWIQIPIPSHEEQEKIAEFLTSLDNKVELINNQLEQARLFKKSLLQKMFV